MKVNYYGEVFELSEVNQNLWISEPTEEEVCLVFERYDDVWYHNFYTIDEIESTFNPYTSYHLTDDMINQILSDTDAMLEAWAIQYGIDYGGE